MLLVTGITGHTGSFFLQELINNKYDGPIRCVVRDTSDTSLIDNSGLNIEKVYGDINDKEFIARIMKNVTTVMHIYNINNSVDILESAINNKVSRVILVHTTGIYSNFKEAAQGYKEKRMKVLKMTSEVNCPTRITILNPTMIYGDLRDKNMSKFIKLVDKLKIVPVISGGKKLIQPVNARDLGKALHSVLMREDITVGQEYDLSGEKPIQIIDALKIISEMLNKKTIFISVPFGLGLFLSKLLKVFTIAKFDYVEKVQRMMEDRSYDHLKAKQDFNYKPMSFEDGIQIEINQYLNR